MQCTCGWHTLGAWRAACAAQVNTPTYNRDLAAATKLLVEANASGILNVGGCEVLGR